ncbi:ThiJ/PfpI family protein [Pleurostoma richardsiae]|uniref:ThiJ/PfpI family protein n=1 Tax=Pleurostoma richardsiae TaxID=41990 RepID=A0AA38SDG6_9PEZI|nr:ThiJ/PfpI family protein [Pleurostoma richardsiae]
MAAEKPTVRIGVFIPFGAQLLDTACVDVFSCMSDQYLSPMRSVPSALKALAPHVSIAYVGTKPAGSLVELTAGVSIPVTHHLDDPEVQPGKLDIVLVPGPDPARDLSDEKVAKWLRGHFNNKDTDMLSVCTGIYLFGEAGLLKGRKACGPRGLQDDIKKKYGDCTLLGHELRWVQDGNFWSSGGVTNGNDLVAAYARESRHFPSPIAEMGTAICDVGDRPQKYSKGQAAFTLGLIWVILKAWFMGTPKAKAKKN